MSYSEFDSIIIDLKILNFKIEDKLLVSLRPPYKYFEEIMLYDNNDTLSFADQKKYMSYSEFDSITIDLEMHSNDNAERFNIGIRSYKEV